ncbi:hypothetical protein B0H14DRAFT_2584512 [Mycena olivaceomarginata]|nr:hypothetical protein B0H14DRAFT_2584512 [Mycena olivaceomarginata]
MTSRRCLGQRGRADIQITESGSTRRQVSEYFVLAAKMTYVQLETLFLLRTVHLVLPRSDSALTGFTGIRTDSPASSGSHAIRGHEESWRPGQRVREVCGARRRALSRQRAVARSSTCSSSGRPCVFHLLARIESSAMAALLDDEDGEGDAGAGGAGDRLRGASREVEPSTRLLQRPPPKTFVNAYCDTCRSLPREDQILIHQMYNAYKDKFGLLYIHIRLLDNSDGVRVIIKAGRTDNLERRIGQYSKCGPGILWISCYPMEYAKATVEQNGSSTCNSRSWAPRFSLFFARAKRHHHEYSCYEAAGELEGAERVVEAALRSLGQEAYRNAKIDLRLGESRGRRSKPGSSYGTTLTRFFLRLKNPETNPFKLASQYSASQLKRELYKLYELVFIEYSGLVRQMKRVVLELFEHLTQKVETSKMFNAPTPRNQGFVVLAQWAISITASCQVAIAQGKKDATEVNRADDIKSGPSAMSPHTQRLYSHDERGPLWRRRIARPNHRFLPAASLSQQRMDAFQVLNAATNKLLQDAEQLELSLASVGVALEQQPLLPQAVHNHIGSCRVRTIHPIQLLNPVADRKLNKARKILEGYHTSFLPYQIAEDPESQYEPGVPNFVYSPLCIRKVTHSVKKRTPTTSPPIRSGGSPPEGRQTLGLSAPCLFHLLEGNTGVDISERGRILILQKDGLTPAQCPDLETWKARAKISAREQEFKRNVNEHESLHPSDVGSPFPGSSPPRRVGTSEEAEGEPSAACCGSRSPGSSTANAGDVMQDEEAHDVEEKVNDPGSPGSVISISSNSDRDEVNVPQSVIVISSTASVEIFDSDESDSDSDLPSVLDLVGRAWS